MTIIHFKFRYVHMLFHANLLTSCNILYTCHWVHTTRKFGNKVPNQVKKKAMWLERIMWSHLCRRKGWCDHIKITEMLIALYTLKAWVVLGLVSWTLIKRSLLKATLISLSTALLARLHTSFFWKMYSLGK